MPLEPRDIRNLQEEPLRRRGRTGTDQDEAEGETRQGSRRELTCPGLYLKLGLLNLISIAPAG